ncbi:MAG TPA: DUF368 domain-containing protein [Planctomycetaceae bacterium]|nr:DUF368 domain-containing protein [Planctomycetaceae bacterium]
MIPRRDLKFIGYGFLMGGADIIPGVSGGTVALILGIYERLVTAISRFDLEFVRALKSRRWLAAAERVDAGFLGALLIGIGTGIASLASLMHDLLNHQRQHTFAVFFGLILASSWIVVRLAGRPTAAFWLLAAAGAVGAYWFVGLPFLESPPTGLWYLFACGTVAICAMILPGVSGAFVLLVLGAYAEITGALRNVLGLREVSDSLAAIVVFVAGCAVGIVSFSKFLKWLLARFEWQTLAVLCGLMLGSLRKIWPFKQDLTPSEPSFSRKQFENLWPDLGRTETWLSLALLTTAAGLVIVLDLWSRHSTRPRPPAEQPASTT